MHATSTDRENWTKIPEDTFYSPENYSKDDFRDPEVFWSEEENCYWMLIAARENTLGGVVAKYTSTDLKNWEFAGPIFAPKEQYMLECPDVFRMGDTYYLTYSWDCVTYYAIGDSPNGPFTAPEDNVLDGNNFFSMLPRRRSKTAIDICADGLVGQGSPVIPVFTSGPAMSLTISLFSVRTVHLASRKMKSSSSMSTI